ncbi:hypothetical protein TNCV_2961311 [Trichonephila clavipes]|nr:hypothetical protein TNCV_2961311 [Trichonephila clavipes]
MTPDSPLHPPNFHTTACFGDNAFRARKDRKIEIPSFISDSTAQGGLWPSQEAFSRPAFFSIVFSNS